MFLQNEFSGKEHAASLCICFVGDTDPICLYTYYYSCCEESLRTMPTWSFNRFPQGLSQ